MKGRKRHGGRRAGRGTPGPFGTRGQRRRYFKEAVARIRTTIKRAQKKAEMMAAFCARSPEEQERIVRRLFEFAHEPDEAADAATDTGRADS